MRFFCIAALAAALPATQALAEGAQAPCAEPPCLAAAPGQIAIIDPETGEILSGDRAAEALGDDSRAAFNRAIEEQLRASFNTENLTETRTVTGAVALDLQGRFQSPLVAEIRPGSTPLIAHPEARHDQH